MNNEVGEELGFRERFKPTSFHIAVLVLRLVLGGAMLEGGLDKLINGFSAVGYLQHGTGPFAGWFASLTSISGVINVLVPWGELLIGIALILGVVVRLASFAAAIMVLLFYLPYLPPSTGWIAQQIVFIFALIVLMLSGNGYFFGLDMLVKQLEQRRNPLRILFG
jgi:thiosulfate dehydrogenase [quinone] large subunit